jgi:hypothetical protein
MPLVRRGPGLIGAAARTAVVAGTAGRVQRRQQQRWAAQDQAAYQEPAESRPASPPPATAPDYAAELEQLAKLRDEGVITVEDFDAKKKQLLGI